MGLGDYDGAEDVDSFSSIFNAPRVFTIPTDPEELKLYDIESTI